MQPDHASVTFTIKQVPSELAGRLKQRAQANRRSLQKELLAIMEAAAEWGQAATITEWPSIAELGRPRYEVKATTQGRTGKRVAKPVGRLTLDQLWQRARKLGPGSAAESADIVRRDRDARHGH